MKTCYIKLQYNMVYMLFNVLYSVCYIANVM